MQLKVAEEQKWKQSVGFIFNKEKDNCIWIHIIA